METGQTGGRKKDLSRADKKKHKGLEFTRRKIVHAVLDTGKELVDKRQITQEYLDAMNDQLVSAPDIETLNGYHTEFKQKVTALAQQYNTRPEDILSTAGKLFEVPEANTENTALTTPVPPTANSPTQTEGGSQQTPPGSERKKKRSPFSGGFSRRRSGSSRVQQKFRTARRVIQDEEPEEPEEQEDNIASSEDESMEESEESLAGIAQDVVNLFREEQRETYSKLCDECGERTKVPGSKLCSPCKRKDIRRINSKERAEKNRLERHLKAVARDNAKREKQVENKRKLQDYAAIADLVIKQLAKDSA